MSRGLPSRTSIHNSCSTLTLPGSLIVIGSFHTLATCELTLAPVPEPHTVMLHVVMLLVRAPHFCGYCHPGPEQSTCVSGQSPVVLRV